MNFKQCAAAVLAAGSLLLTGLPVCAEEETTSNTYEDGMFTFAYTDDGGVELCGVDPSAYAVKLPDATDGRRITGIGDGAFYGCSALQSVTFGKYVKYIGESAFENCESLQELEIPDSVETIGKYAFCGCTSLTSLTLPDDLTEIPEGMCYLDALLQDVNYPASVKSIGATAFYQCTMLPSPALPEQLESIGDYSFAICPNITEMQLPDSLKSIGPAAFFNCTGISDITIPAEVEKIGTLCFAGCSSLTGFSVQEGNASFTAEDGILYSGGGKVLFAYPAGRTDDTFTVPDGVETIYDAAFYAATDLQSVQFPASLRTIGSAAFEWNGLRSLTIPEGVHVIGENAFADCTALTSVSFPTSLQSIGSYAFFACTALKEVSVPPGCKEGEYAFGYTDDPDGGETPVKIDGFRKHKAIPGSTILLIVAGVLAVIIIILLVRIIRKNQLTKEEQKALRPEKPYRSIADTKEDEDE